MLQSTLGSLCCAMATSLSNLHKLKAILGAYDPTKERVTGAVGATRSPHLKEITSLGVMVADDLDATVPAIHKSFRATQVPGQPGYWPTSPTTAALEMCHAETMPRKALEVKKNSDYFRKNPSLRTPSIDLSSLT